MTFNKKETDIVEFVVSLTEEEGKAFLCFRSPLGERHQIEFRYNDINQIDIDAIDCLADCLKVMVEIAREHRQKEED